MLSHHVCSFKKNVYCAASRQVSFKSVSQFVVVKIWLTHCIQNCMWCEHSHSRDALVQLRFTCLRVAAVDMSVGRRCLARKPSLLGSGRNVVTESMFAIALCHVQLVPYDNHALLPKRNNLFDFLLANCFSFSSEMCLGFTSAICFDSRREYTSRFFLFKKKFNF